MFKKLLIANRGEIAVRIIRAARELGIQTVAIYSEADKDSLHTMLADEAICIGPAKSTDSYLNMNRVLSAAIVTEAQAIHPGFGFLSENSKFATLCEEMNIKFIGPSGEVMDKMGDKINARAEMIKANVPVIPGSDGEVFTAEEALEVANHLGYPVMLKASAGGGGKGIRKVNTEEELAPAFESASQEAKAAFGNGAMYIEKVIYPARHIEVQILGDSYGHPVTEFVSGVDIVKEQIRIAAGEKLSVTQDDIEIKGHAIECRINAENPKFNFAPSPGKISNLYLPSGGVGLRVDSAVYPGYTIPPYYDSMIAKIIVHGENRFEALMKMQRALYELEIDGVVTNADFQLDLISDRSVIAGDYDTSFLMETFLPDYQNREE